VAVPLPPHRHLSYTINLLSISMDSFDLSFIERYHVKAAPDSFYALYLYWQRVVREIQFGNKGSQNKSNLQQFKLHVCRFVVTF